MGCNAKASSAVTRISYYRQAFELDGTKLYECKADGKKGGSSAYVCNGLDGIQQLKYSTKNCKGKSTQFRKITFQQMKAVCSYSSEAKVYNSATCYGPGNMN